MESEDMAEVVPLFGDRVKPGTGILVRVYEVADD